ncbi:MAG TPA: hypothetical protein VMS89_02500 [Methanoregulaceae archaeon]|nr:hypothetical protein [Methanoregulaceae archaeon]
MSSTYTTSPAVQDLISHAEELLNIEIVIHREAEAPQYGLLIDTYSFDVNKNVIVYSNSQLGLLKDYIIAQNCVKLLMRGASHKLKNYRTLSYDSHSAAKGMYQIYLDTLKDDKTRVLDIGQKKKLMYYLFMLFHESLIDLPWAILGNLYLTKECPVLHNAQAYFLIKESMRDMHELVAFKDMLPRRYFVMHNAMYYARDMFLADITAEIKLNPLINIPELQKFRNLDVKEMMSHRWSQSYWYHTKLVGDAMSNIVRMAVSIDFSKELSLDFYADMYALGVDITNRWLVMMRMQDWYRWELPEHLRTAEQNCVQIEQEATQAVFGI